NLRRIVGRSKGCKPALALGTPDPDKPRRATISRSRPEFHQIIQLAQLMFGHGLPGPSVTRASRAEQSIKGTIIEFARHVSLPLATTMPLKLHSQIYELA